MYMYLKGSCLQCLPDFANGLKLWQSKTFHFSISFTFTFYTSGVSKNWRQYSVSSVEDISLGVQLAGNDPEAGSWNESRPILLWIVNKVWDNFPTAINLFHASNFWENFLRKQHATEAPPNILFSNFVKYLQKKSSNFVSLIVAMTDSHFPFIRVFKTDCWMDERIFEIDRSLSFPIVSLIDPPR